MSEQIYFNEGNVQVTRSRVVIGSRTYPMNGITSIRTVRIPPNRIPSILLGLFGLLVILLSQFNLTTIFLGFILVGVAVLIWKLQKTTFCVYFGTAGGEKQALSIEDENYVLRVAGAIDQALIERG